MALNNSYFKHKVNNSFCFLSFLLLLLCFHASASTSRYISTGVSTELANLRTKELKDIKYYIHFTISKNESLNIQGEEILSFLKRGNAPIAIDFKASKRQIKQIIANKNCCPIKYINEHIIIDNKFLKKGHNIIHISFIANKKPFNRNKNFLYTLFVPDKARSAFPCFDQPNLKAKFQLQLSIPNNWSAISNTNIEKIDTIDNIHNIKFLQTKLLPTYLFSFAAGEFKKKSCIRNGRCINAYYRETDTQKIAQLDTIFDEIYFSINWLEKYTNISYPFSKYDLIILPGFQFGGMEHPGAILFKDRNLFLSSNPTPEEQLNRMEVIAHETTHIWFGDLVTMKWFNDVWIKEVFANYLAAKITEPKFPNINHQLNFLRNYNIPALSEDRTEGTHSIQQPLDNLQNAGLLYGNIIYNKAPIVMRNLEQMIGANSFKHGIQKYLQIYAYKNATWNDLINILEKENPEANVNEFSDVWVKQKGFPDISVKLKKGNLLVSQTDKYKRGILWKQLFSIGLVYKDTIISQTVNINHSTLSIALKQEPLFLLPNYDGKGYGRFLTDSASTSYQLEHWFKLPTAVAREATLINMYENYLSHHITINNFSTSLITGLTVERDPLITSTCCDYLSALCFKMNGTDRIKIEQSMWNLSKYHPIKSCKQKLLRSLINNATEPSIIENLYSIWEKQNEPLLNENDYISLSYQLAILKPKQYKQILCRQRQRLTNEDRKEEFDYISRACSPNKNTQLILFKSLMNKSNRLIEPWTEKLLSLLNHALREPYSNQYITPGLNILNEIQKTGDIFFPRGWTSALLSNHRSNEARNLVILFLKKHPNYSVSLRNKILQTAFPLLNK